MRKLKIYYYVDCPKEKRENLYYKHNAIKHATAYKSGQSSSVTLDISDTKFAYEKIRSTALWMLVGRGEHIRNDSIRHTSVRKTFHQLGSWTQ